MIQGKAHEKPERLLWVSNTVLIMIKIILKWTCITGVLIFKRALAIQVHFNILEKLIQNKE